MTSVDWLIVLDSLILIVGFLGILIFGPILAMVFFHNERLKKLELIDLQRKYMANQEVIRQFFTEAIARIDKTREELRKKYPKMFEEESE